MNSSNLCEAPSICHFYGREKERLLDRLEAALQLALEGVARLLPGKLHPLEMAAQLRVAMDDSHVMSPEAGYVANTYRLLLSPPDFAPLAQIKTDIEAELADHLRQYADQRGYACGPRMSVRITSEPGASPGRAKVTAEFDRSPIPAMLHVTDGLPPQTFTVTEPVTLGRDAECEIRLADPTVSRRHGRLTWTYQGWTLRDLGSNNGTQVNGQLVNAHLLRDNDLIQLGNVQLRFSFHSE